MFYTVVRYFYVGDKETHFVQHFDTYEEAQIQHYKNIAADLDREGCTYQASHLIDSNGLVRDSKVFDRRGTVEPEEAEQV